MGQTEKEKRRNRDDTKKGCCSATWNRRDFMGRKGTPFLMHLCIEVESVAICEMQEQRTLITETKALQFTKTRDSERSVPQLSALHFARSGDSERSVPQLSALHFAKSGDSERSVPQPAALQFARQGNRERLHMILRRSLSPIQQI